MDSMQLDSIKGVALYDAFRGQHRRLKL